MRLLLDTQALLWLLIEPARLRREALAAITDAENLVAVSPVTPWEIELKRADGKLDAPDDLARQLEDAGFVVVPIELRHALAAGRLPRHHRDPFDRMLVAQAQLESLAIVTSDERIARYQVTVLPA